MARPSLSVILYLLTVTEATFFCRDEENNVVEWFVGYKLPHIKDSSHQLVQEGLAYTYVTSDNVARGWRLSARSINDTLSILGRTLQPLYASNIQPNLLQVLYNDQPPAGNVSFDKGHTKGVVMCGSDGGSWLVHSIPHFPPVAAGYAYPHSGRSYGQSFLCLSLDLRHMDLVGLQLMYNEPLVYNSSVLDLPVPNLLAAAKGRTVSTPPWFHQVELSTLNGSLFTSFAKSFHFHKELYADWVAVALQSDLAVESWLNGKDPLPSSCVPPYIVENVASVDMNVASVNFSTHLDHSKWAVSLNDSGKTWVCVGDINRMASQKQRGGGTVCMQDARLWAAYHTLVSNITACVKPTTHLQVLLAT